MKTMRFLPAVLVAAILVFTLSCQKEPDNALQPQEETPAVSLKSATPPFNIEVILRGEEKAFGHVKFRQDLDLPKVVLLGVWVRDLEPLHSYYLQRAANAFNGDCPTTGWLTLGEGPVATPFTTDEDGTAKVDFWRNVSGAVGTVPGDHFDIRFRVVDAANMNVAVLESSCYDYVIR
jgi:hypothetical protein